MKYTQFNEQYERGISIDSVGHITTTQNKGKYTVMVEDFGIEKQLMIVNVLVTSIYSILVENSYKVLYLPTDSEIKLQIILQDIFGRHFPKSIKIDFHLKN